ncbi:hypothetical protein ISE1_2722 [plant metagenome]|uniref:Uncharacterized protein n=1 Tax=plant metagenome TaxID=1297885 RepID=A0A484UI62_9ZZZZ
MTITNHFEQLRRAAIDRGLRDFERGMSLSDNPFNGAATDERESWDEGWENGRALADRQ